MRHDPAALTPLLDILECPFCGGPLGLEGDEQCGVLSCHCNAYPLVAGIPFLRNAPQADAAMAHVGAGSPEQALGALLDIDPGVAAELGASGTFAGALDTLAPDDAVALHRFSEPAFLVTEALALAAAAARVGDGPVLDLCGGAGHLSRVIARAKAEALVVLADGDFRKLWLATTFVAPYARPVCCDPEAQLPFRSDAFSALVCADALHHVWQKRSFAREMARVVADAAPVVVPHLHNALSWNWSEGMPLTPEGYTRLLPGARLFRESALLGDVLDAGELNLSRPASDADLGDEPSLALVWDPTGRLPERHPLPTPMGEALNPLYEAEGETLTLRFPSPEYAEEHAAAQRYLPETVNRSAASQKELAARRVLLDLPDRYLPPGYRPRVRSAAGWRPRAWTAPPVSGLVDLVALDHPTGNAFNRLAHRHLENALAAAAKEHARGRLLDVGCGLKPYRELFAPYVDEHVGVDHADSPHALISVDVVATAYDIPLEAATFDTVMMTELLEHLETPGVAIAEAFRLLRPGGKIILTAPFVWTLHEEPRDFFRYTPYGLHHLLTAAGFEEIDVIPLSGQWGTLAIQFSYALRSSLAAELGAARLGSLASEIQRIGAQLDHADFRPWLSWNHLAVGRRAAGPG
jgi:ubiquinone/menaquinone biosynthesis C-methylase UbiE/uncharacterized protein YbaR (Trm112 family)